MAVSEYESFGISVQGGHPGASRRIVDVQNNRMMVPEERKPRNEVPTDAAVTMNDIGLATAQDQHQLKCRGDTTETGWLATPNRQAANRKIASYLFDAIVVSQGACRAHVNVESLTIELLKQSSRHHRNTTGSRGRQRKCKTPNAAFRLPGRHFRKPI